MTASAHPSHSAWDLNDFSLKNKKNKLVVHTEVEIVPEFIFHLQNAKDSRKWVCTKLLLLTERVLKPVNTE